VLSVGKIAAGPDAARYYTAGYALRDAREARDAAQDARLSRHGTDSAQFLRLDHERYEREQIREETSERLARLGRPVDPLLPSPRRPIRHRDLDSDLDL
jgi:hypothetical protein